MGIEGYSFSTYEGFSISDLTTIQSNYDNIINNVDKYNELNTKLSDQSQYSYSITDFSNKINSDIPDTLIEARHQDTYNQLLQTNISYTMGSIACVTLIIAAIVIARE
jgi:hypothetical protein